MRGRERDAPFVENVKVDVSGKLSLRSLANHYALNRDLYFQKQTISTPTAKSQTPKNPNPTGHREKPTKSTATNREKWSHPPTLSSRIRGTSMHGNVHSTLLLSASMSETCSMASLLPLRAHTQRSPALKMSTRMQLLPQTSPRTAKRPRRIRRPRKKNAEAKQRWVRRR